MKKIYSAPRARVVELQSEGVIADSGSRMRARTINHTSTDEWGDAAETRSKLWGED